MKNRRTQYEIYWEILTFCKTQKTITSIIQHCNLNSKIGKDYITFLLKKNYLKKIGEKSMIYYIISDNAQDFLHLFSKLYKELFEKKPFL